MQRDHALEESGFRRGNILDGLARNRLGQKADEVAGVPRIECHADLALCLESANAGTMACARIDDNEGPLAFVNVDTGRRSDARQHVVHRAWQGSPVHDQLGAEFQDVGRELGDMLLAMLAALPHHIEKEDSALKSIKPIRPSVLDEIGCPRRKRRV